MYPFSAAKRRRRRLDSNTKFEVLLVSRVGVDVVWCPAMELVALAQLTSNDNPDGQHSNTG
jgi:hypothetical protein